MNQIKILSMQDLFPIREIKEEINLFMFNSPLFTTNDMQINNQLMEALSNVKFEISTNN